MSFQFSYIMKGIVRAKLGSVYKISSYIITMRLNNFISSIMVLNNVKNVEFSVWTENNYNSTQSGEVLINYR